MVEMLSLLSVRRHISPNHAKEVRSSDGRRLTGVDDAVVQLDIEVVLCSLAWVGALEFDLDSGDSGWWASS